MARKKRPFRIVMERPHKVCGPTATAVATLRFCSRTLWLAALAATAPAARAAIIDGDDRVAVARNQGSAYAAIGRVIGGGRAGTGFLVGECHVLTAQHNAGDGPSPVGQAMIFRASGAGHARSPPSSRGIIVASGDFDFARRPGNWSEGRSRDWILIRLDRCLGQSLGFVALGVDQEFRFDQADAPVQSAGFPSDRRSPDTLVLDPSCRIRGGNYREWMHDCAALPGNSGSPLFQAFRSGGRVRLRVVAMVTSGEHSGAARPYDNATANRATKIAYIIPAIARFLEPPRSAERIKKGPGVAPRPLSVIP